MKKLITKSDLLKILETVDSETVICYSDESYGTIGAKHSSLQVAKLVDNNGEKFIDEDTQDPTLPSVKVLVLS